MSPPCQVHRQQWVCSQSAELPVHNSYGSPCAPTTPSEKCEYNFNLVSCNFKFTLFPSVSTLLTIIWDVPLLPTWDDSKMSQLIYKSAGPTATKPLPSSNSSPSWGCAPSSDSPEGLEIGADAQITRRASGGRGDSHLGRAQTNNDFLKSENVPNVLPPQWHDGWHLTTFEEPLIQSCVKPAPLVPDKLTRRKVRKRKVEEETGLIMNWRTQTHWSTNLFRIWMIAEYSIHLWYHSLQMYSLTLT